MDIRNNINTNARDSVSYSVLGNEMIKNQAALKPYQIWVELLWAKKEFVEFVSTTTRLVQSNGYARSHGIKSVTIAEYLDRLEYLGLITGYTRIPGALSVELVIPEFLTGGHNG